MAIGEQPMSLHRENDKINGIERFEVESAMRSMERAEEIKKDPKMLAAVKVLAKKRIGEITSIAELKEVRDRKLKEKV